MVSQGGAVGLVETVRIVGLDRTLSEALVPWRKPNAAHNPGKIITDLALSLAVGGDCLADIAVLRDQPRVFGAVTLDPTVSRLVDTLAADAGKALAAIDSARAATRGSVWALAGADAPNHQASVDEPVIVDLDATLLTAHSDKEQAAPTFKRGFGSTHCSASSTTARTAPVNHCRPAEPRQRRVEHRRRPHRGRQESPRAAARPPAR